MAPDADEAVSTLSHDRRSYFRDLVSALSFGEAGLRQLRYNPTFSSRLSARLTREALNDLASIQQTAIDELTSVLDEAEEQQKRLKSKKVK